MRSLARRAERDARAAERLDDGAAPVRRRRRPRAPHPAHQPAREPRRARAQPRPPARGARPRCCARARPSRTGSCTCSTGCTALARGEAADALPREDVELADLVDAAVYAARRRHPAVTLRAGGDDRRRPPARLGGRAAAAGRQPARQRGAARRQPRPRATSSATTAGCCCGSPTTARASRAEERERLLEPFARGDGTGAPGTGLGLAIVAQQVALHGGSLSLGDSDLGGLQAEVRLSGSGDVSKADIRVRIDDP